MMTINIGAASPDRARMLLDWLARRPEDVFILTETSAGPGTTYLLDQFRALATPSSRLPTPAASVAVHWSAASRFAAT
jgi:hypothetical protein